MSTSRTSAPARRSLVLPIVVLAAVALLAFAAFAGGSGDEVAAPPETDPGQGANVGPGTEDRPTADAEDIMAQLGRRDAGDPLALGEVDAPVLMIEWADFQCPFCASFARDTKPELQPYIDDGTLRIEWRDFPILGDESWTAALATRAAGEQDAFWPMHDEIFSEDRDRNAGELARGPLVDMAADLGLDTERFERDLDDPALREAVEQDLRIGQQLGITGTPAFLINGQVVIGGQPAEVFIEAVEQAAASS
jgi:protein-disulfide isomerase